MKNSSSSNPSGDMMIINEISLKNHVTYFDEYSIDGWLEFTKKGDNGTKEEYICADCLWFRSFDRMNIQSL